MDGITNSMDMSLSKVRAMVKDREAWGAAVHGVTKIQTRLSDWTTKATSGEESACRGEMQEMWVQSLGWEDPLQYEMATCSSILVWKTPWTEEPGRLQSMGSQRVVHK